MKFDLDTAWKDTTRLLRDNLALLAVIAGVFYFVPYAAALLWVPGLAELTMGQFDPASPAMEGMANELIVGYWWALLLLGVIQGIGLLAMLALLRRRANPTVGEAIQAGALSVPSYIAVQILQGLLLTLIILVFLAIPLATGLRALAILGGIVGFIGVLYVVTKLSVAAAVIAIEDERNPLHAISRSWRLTKGNSLRLFFFYALIFIAYLIISALISMLFALVFALGGSDVQTFGQAISASLMNALLALLFACILGAVHRQLARLGASNADMENQES